MTNAGLAATYSDFKLIRTRKVVQLIFEIPLENADSALAVLGGMPNPAAETWCAIARLDPKTMQSGADAAATEDSPPPKRLTQRAVMLCKDMLFRRFLIGGADEISEATAADFVRVHCGVASRSQIIPGTPAADRFEELLSGFAAWRLASTNETARI